MTSIPSRILIPLCALAAAGTVEATQVHEGHFVAAHHLSMRGDVWDQSDETRLGCRMTWILRLWEACCTRHAEMQQCDHAEMLQLQWRWAVIGCAPALLTVQYCTVG